jgi:hypothetical protein
MSNYVDPAYLQKFLLAGSDLWAEKIKNKYPNSYKIDNTLRLNAYTNTKPFSFLLSDADAHKCAERQSQFFSCHPTPTNESAYELFGDYDFARKTAIETDGVAIDNILYVHSYDNDVLKRYKIDLDELNESGIEFIISDITITNKSKDIFTLRANYRVEMTFNFTKFEDLTEPIIPAKDENGKTVKVQPIIIINMYNRSVPRVNQAEVCDNNGLYLSQKLTLDPIPRLKKVFPKTEQDFSKFFYRNFHLILEKHEFSLASDNKETIVPFKQILKVSFVSYEADETDKPLAANDIPKTTGNLYSLLTSSNGTYAALRDDYSNKLDVSLGSTTTNPFGNFLDIDSFTKHIQLLNELLEKDQLFLTCYYESKRQPKRASPFSNISSGDIGSIEERIKATKNIIEVLEQRFRLTLTNYIILQSNIFYIEVPSQQLKVYEKNEFFEKFNKELGFGDLFIGALNGGIGAQALLAVGAFLLPEAAITIGVTRGLISLGSAIGVGFAVKGAADKASVPTLVTEGFDATTLKTGLRSIDVKLELSNNFRTHWTSTIAKSLQSASKTTPFSPIKATETTKKFFDDFEAGLKGSFGIKVPEDASATTRVIRFILFKDIIKIINQLVNNSTDPSVYVISGGKTSFSKIQQKHIFLNCLDVPIEINFFISFLKRNILDRKNLNYSSETFLRDAFEQLIRFDESIFSNSPQIPASVRMNYSLHDSKNPSFKTIKGFIGKGPTVNDGKGEINILNDSDYKDLKQSYMKTKVFDLVNNVNATVKIYVIGAEQELSKVNYYSEYRSIAGSDLKKEKDFNSHDFQKFFIEKHGFPCLITQYVKENKVPILFDDNIKYTRADNPQLETGQVLQQQSLLKLPYQFTADFKYIFSYFLDIGSYIFLVPPGAPFDKQNKLGFGGLYVINSSEIKIIFPNFENPAKLLTQSKVTIGGLHLSYADYEEATNPPPGNGPVLVDNICFGSRTDPKVRTVLNRKISGQAGSGKFGSLYIDRDEKFFSEFLYGSKFRGIF